MKIVDLCQALIRGVQHFEFASSIRQARSCSIGVLLLIGSWGSVVQNDAWAESSAPQKAESVSLRADQNKVPEPLKDVGVDEHLGAKLDFSKLNFRNENGELISFQSMFDGKRPVLLSMVYYECPMLCTLVLNGIMDGIAELDLNLGQHFKMVSVSIDPKDRSDTAGQKRDNYLKNYARGADASSWSFLTGDETAIQDLAKQVGFAYKYVGGEDRYAHPAVLFVLTPDGKVSRYLYGAHYKTRDLRFALIEAGQGRVGNVVDRFLMFCYHYEPSQRGYVVSAVRLMQVSAFLTVLFLMIFIGGFWLSEHRKGRLVTGKEKQA